MPTPFSAASDPAGFPRINTKLVSLCLGFILAMAAGGQAAPSSGDIQEIAGHLYPGEREVYDLPNLTYYGHLVAPACSRSYSLIKKFG